MNDGSFVTEFIDYLKVKGRNEKDEKIVFTPWLEDCFTLLADLRIPQVTTTGCSQLSKTMSCSQLNSYLGVVAKLNTLWSFPVEAQRLTLVKSQHRPVIMNMQRRSGNMPGQGDSKDLSLIQTSGGNNYFINLVEASASSGVAAGAGSVAISAAVLFVEEISQYQAASVSVLKRRLDRSPIVSRPVRPLGTPGSSGALETLIRASDYYFYPSCVCKNCKEITFLNPFGALLQEIDKDTYLTPLGRPEKWFHKDPNDPIESAYIGCQTCGAEISYQNRVHESRMRDIKTGVTVQEFLDSWDKESFVTVAINMSPLVRDRRKDLAAGIIREGLSSANSADWCQQSLGQSSTNAANSITEAQIVKASTDPHPKGKPKVKSVGIDMGRGGAYQCQVSFYLDPNKDYESAEEQYWEAVRVIDGFYFGDKESTVSHAALDGFTVGLIDAYPSPLVSANLAKQLGFGLCAQKVKQLDGYKVGECSDFGETFPVYNLNNSCFESTFKLWAAGKYRLSESLVHEIFSKNPGSWTSHLQSVEWNVEEALVRRSSSKQDDFYFAMCFANAAFMIYLNEGNFGFQSLLDWSWLY
ncbi:MAG: hypothetical protein ACRC8K_02220 [Waterburya sp.]